MSFCRFRLLLPFFLFTFAEDKLHSAICKQAYIALVCIIFAKNKLHLGIGYKLRQSRVDEFLLMQAAKPSERAVCFYNSNSL